MRTLQDQFAENDLRRLRELRHPETDHQWLWHVDPSLGTVLPREDFKRATQARLGAHFLQAPSTCGLCGALMDTKMGHYGCCAPAERTKGHYFITKCLMPFVLEVDSGATMEEQGLSWAEPGARPGDITTTALGGLVTTAMDVTVASQDAAGASDDCCATAYRRKLARYAAVIASWEGESREFQPLVWSQEGRPHNMTTETLTRLATALTRIRGGSVPLVLKRITREVGTQLALRRSRMIQRLFPALDPDSWRARYGTAPVPDRPAENPDPWGGYEEAAAVEQLGNPVLPWDGVDGSWNEGDVEVTLADGTTSGAHLSPLASTEPELEPSAGIVQGVGATPPLHQGAVTRQTSAPTVRTLPSSVPAANSTIALASTRARVEKRGMRNARPPPPPIPVGAVPRASILTETAKPERGVGPPTAPPLAGSSSSRSSNRVGQHAHDNTEARIADRGGAPAGGATDKGEMRSPPSPIPAGAVPRNSTTTEAAKPEARAGPPPGPPLAGPCSSSSNQAEQLPHGNTEALTAGNGEAPAKGVAVEVGGVLQPPGAAACPSHATVRPCYATSGASPREPTGAAEEIVPAPLDWISPTCTPAINPEHTFFQPDGSLWPRTQAGLKDLAPDLVERLVADKRRALDASGLEVEEVLASQDDHPTIAVDRQPTRDLLASMHDKPASAWVGTLADRRPVHAGRHEVSDDVVDDLDL